MFNCAYHLFLKIGWFRGLLEITPASECNSLCFFVMGVIFFFLRPGSEGSGVRNGLRWSGMDVRRSDVILDSS
jgi:hypothetical protein